jgi:hypothetical protein
MELAAVAKTGATLFVHTQFCFKKYFMKQNSVKFQGICCKFE